jgi:AcrR family transcriptional regulator
MGTKQRFDLDVTRTKIIELLLRHDPRDLNFSKVSRFLKIPRSTLYYYFGNRFDNLLQDAVKFGVDQFLQTEHLKKYTSYSSWEEFQRQRLENSLDIVKAFPWAPLLYIRFRVDPGPLGESVMESERRYLKEYRKICKHFCGREPNINNERIVAGLKVGLMWGLGSSLPPFEKQNPVDFEEVKKTARAALMPIFKTLLF